MQTDTASHCFCHFSSVFCFCYYSHFLWCILVLLPLSGFIYCWISVTAKKEKPKPFLLMYFCLLQSPALSPLSANTWQTASKTKENMSTCNPASVWMLQIYKTNLWGVFAFIVYLQWRQAKNVRKGSKEDTENQNISLEIVQQYWKYWFSKPFQNYRSSFWMDAFFLKLAGAGTLVAKINQTV